MFKITTEITCDLSTPELKKLGIDCLDYQYQIGGELFSCTYENEDELVNSFYSKIRKGERSTTSQVPPQGYEDFFEPFIKNGEKDILHLSISSGVTSTNFSKINEDLNAKWNSNIKILDTLCCSAGMQVLLDIAIKAKNDGKNIEEVYSMLDELKRKVHHYFVVGDLNYFKRSGRLSTKGAFFGNLFNIKPLLTVSKQGKLVPLCKTMGIKKALKDIVKYTKENISDETEYVYMAVGDAKDSENFITPLLKEALPNKTLKRTCIGKAVGSHVGYDTLTVIFLAKTDRLVD